MLWLKSIMSSFWRLFTKHQSAVQILTKKKCKFSFNRFVEKVLTWNFSKLIWVFFWGGGFLSCRISYNKLERLQYIFFHQKWSIFVKKKGVPGCSRAGSGRQRISPWRWPPSWRWRPTSWLSDLREKSRNCVQQNQNKQDRL